MKLRYLLLSLLLSVALFASSKDVIMRMDGTYIDATVEEITETTIRYRKANNPSGPIYTIPLNTVTKIVYENGSIDDFNTPTESKTPIQSTPPPSSDMGVTPSAHSNNIPDNTMTDAQLLRYLNQNTSSADQLRASAKRFRLIGWIGGGILLTATIIGSASINGIDTAVEYAAPVGGSVAALAWCVGFNIYANRLKNQAREMEFYSTSIIEDRVFSFGDNTLIAGLSLVGNHMTHTQGYGLSLKFTF